MRARRQKRWEADVPMDDFDPDAMLHQMHAGFAAITQSAMGMDRFEYKIVPVGKDPAALEAELCELGADRWQLASVKAGNMHLLMWRPLLADETQFADLLAGVTDADG
jgi:hypothetical protein